MAEIAKAAKEQALGVTQVNVALGQMDRIAQSNAAGAEESATAAEELNAQAESLKLAVEQLESLVGRFESSDRPQDPPAVRPMRPSAQSSPRRWAPPGASQQRLSQLPAETLDRIPMPDLQTLGDDDKDFRSF